MVASWSASPARHLPVVAGWRAPSSYIGHFDVVHYGSIFVVFLAMHGYVCNGYHAPTSEYQDCINDPGTIQQYLSYINLFTIMPFSTGALCARCQALFYIDLCADLPRDSKTQTYQSIKPEHSLLADPFPDVRGNMYDAPISGRVKRPRHHQAVPSKVCTTQFFIAGTLYVHPRIHRLVRRHVRGPQCHAVLRLRQVHHPVLH